MSGRACCGGNGNLCSSSDEAASNVISLCQSSCCTVTKEQSQIHTYKHTLRKTEKGRRPKKMVCSKEAKKSERNKLRKRVVKDF